MGRTLLATLLVALAVVTPAHAGWDDDGARARRGLAAAVAAGYVPALDAQRYGASVTRSLAVLRRLPRDRAQNLGAVLRDVAAQSGRYTQPRALALFSMLDVNTRHLGDSALPKPGTDVRDVDGVVYRAFAGRGLQFHPLGSFGKLNAEIVRGRNAQAHRLAFALLARAVPSGQSLVWEYYFRFNGGAPPWRSGMAQAVAAQALARGGFLVEARRAYLALPAGLLLPTSAGPWIRLYSFNSLTVLNAQLQTALSVGEYALLAKDRGAAELAPRLEASAAGLLPLFDTGGWSRYALGGKEAALDYHRYVVSLLERLANRPEGESFRPWAVRFGAYLRLPPELVAGPPGPAAYPQPADGHRDAASVSFRLSKPATVTLFAAGERRSASFGAGSGAIAWYPGNRPPGLYNARLRAVDIAGNATEVEAAPITVKRDTVAPEVSARAEGRRLVWHGVDEGTPWLRLALRLERAGQRRVIALGINRVSGSLRLRLPRGTWTGTLIARDSSGNRSDVDLGKLH